MMPLGSVSHSAYSVWAAEIMLTVSLTETCASCHVNGVPHTGGSASVTA